MCDLSEKALEAALTLIGLEHEEDTCNCPACAPICERTGQKCWIICERCQDKPETDGNGPLKSKTRRLNEKVSGC